MEEELMALVDKLEMQPAARKRQKLLEVFVSELTLT